MKKRILAVLLVLAMALAPTALAAGTTTRVLTKDGPVWVGVQGEGGDSALVYSTNKGKSWNGTAGFESEASSIQGIQYTGRNYFLTYFWCKMAFTSEDGIIWSQMPERGWFYDNSLKITNGLCSGKYQLLWTGSEYMMCQSIKGDPREAYAHMSENPRNKMVTFLDEGYSILGAMEFDGEVTGIRYKDDVYYATVDGTEHSFTRADWDLGQSLDHAAATSYVLRQVEKDGVTYLDRAYDGRSWVRLKDLPWGENETIDLQPTIGGDFAVRVADGPVYTSHDALTWTAWDAESYEADVGALKENSTTSPGEVAVSGQFFTRLAGKALQISRDGVYWMEVAYLEDLPEGMELYMVTPLRVGALAELGTKEGPRRCVLLEQQILSMELESAFPYPLYYVTLDGTYISFDNPPYEKNSRMMVPLRGVSEALGFTVDYDDKGVTCTKGDTVITVEFGTSSATVNGEAHTLDAGVEVYRDRTYVPIRFFSEQMGLDVNWDAEKGTAVLTTKP